MNPKFPLKAEADLFDRRECEYCGAESDFRICAYRECRRKAACGIPTKTMGYLSVCGDHWRKLRELGETE